MLFDGWSLVYEPNSVPALHLRALLEYFPDGFIALLALPGEPPTWLPEAVQRLVSPTTDTERYRLLWEQRTLPALAKDNAADLVHVVGLTPALFAATPVLISPAGYGDDQDNIRSLSARLRDAFSSGGLSRAKGVLLPDDLPTQDFAAPVYRLPAFTQPGFDLAVKQMPGDLTPLRLPDTYILYHGPQGDTALRNLLEAWRWAAGSIGEDYPLILLGLVNSSRARLQGLIGEYGLSGSVRALPVIRPESIAWLYQNCQVLFHPAEIPLWGGAVRLAMACGKPIVALETPRTDALVGSAAYLVSGMLPRDFGAALITLVLEEEIAGQLSAAARKRVSLWNTSLFRQNLEELYRSVISPAG